jgi:hypothetical protein
MNNETKFKVGDAVIVTAKDSSEGAHGRVVKISKSPYFDYRVRLSDGIEWAYKADELKLYEAARPEQGIRVESEADTITITTADAHNIVIALVGQIKRLNENIDDPDYEGDTDNLVRLVQETEAILDRLTAQLNANGG